MDQTNSPVTQWMNRTVVDATGSKVGTVSDVYLDDSTGQPDWLAVKTGLFGTKLSFVPVEGSKLSGDVVAVMYDKNKISDAPRIDADGELSSDEVRALYSFYGRTAAARAPLSTPTPTPPRSVGDADAAASMVRSEEELSVGKHTQEAGRVTLRKWVETEDVQVTVPVERQMARVVRESVAEGDVGSVGEFVESQEEIVLSEEVVDVSKRVVAKERIALETETVTEQVPVSETVRKERVEVDGDDIVGRDSTRG